MVVKGSDTDETQLALNIQPRLAGNNICFAEQCRQSCSVDLTEAPYNAFQQ